MASAAVFDLNADNTYYVAALPAIGSALVGLMTMIAFTVIVQAKPVGTEKMKDLAEKIHKGAVDFLLTEYKFLAVFVLFIFALVSCILIGAEDGMGQPKDTFGL